MIISILFIFTSVVCIMAGIKLVGLIFGHSMELPPVFLLTLTEPNGGNIERAF